MKTILLSFRPQIISEYQKISGHPLEKAIRDEFSGDIMDGLVAIVQCTSNKSDFFASRLHKSMAGMGTNDNQLIRLIVTRCEIDLNDIKRAFEQKYGKSLRSWIKVRHKLVYSKTVRRNILTLETDYRATPLDIISMPCTYYVASTNLNKFLYFPILLH